MLQAASSAALSRSSPRTEPTSSTEAHSTPLPSPNTSSAQKIKRRKIPDPPKISPVLIDLSDNPSNVFDRPRQSVHAPAAGPTFSRLEASDDSDYTPAPSLFYHPSEDLHFLKQPGHAPFVPDAYNVHIKGKVPPVTSKQSATVPHLKGRAQNFTEPVSIYGPLKCDECSKTFYEYTHLKLHKKTHTGTKGLKSKPSFQCEHCSQSFADEAALTVSCFDIQVA